MIDCPDPRALAEFYCQVLGMRVNEDIGDWVVIGLEPRLRQLAFQRAAEWVPPRWPDPAHPQLSASLAADTPVSLRDTISGLDDRNAALVVTAIQHAAGKRP